MVDALVALSRGDIDPELALVVGVVDVVGRGWRTSLDCHDVVEDTNSVGAHVHQSTASALARQTGQLIQRARNL